MARINLFSPGIGAIWDFWSCDRMHPDTDERETNGVGPHWITCDVRMGQGRFVTLEETSLVITASINDAIITIKVS